MDRMDLVVDFGCHPVAAFSGPDGSLALYELVGLSDALSDKLKADGFQLLGVVATMPNGNTDFGSNGVVRPAVAFAVVLAYRQHIEALNTTSGDYDWNARRYH
jgi:hypothetical protein